MKAATVFALAVLVAAVSACDPPEECTNVDMGTCGNACCELLVHAPMSADKLRDAIVDALKKGGADGAYGYNGGQDLTPYYKDTKPFKYIDQGTHTTKVKKYVDTLNFNIQVVNDNESLLKAFSISNIFGALGDYGQNYANLSVFLKGLGLDLKMTIVHGCGKKPSLKNTLI